MGIRITVRVWVKREQARCITTEVTRMRRLNFQYAFQRKRLEQYYSDLHVNYPHLKKQASEEASLKTQASSPQALSFPVYPGDILCHVCKRDPVARQATPVFHR